MRGAVRPRPGIGPVVCPVRSSHQPVSFPLSAARHDLGTSIQRFVSPRHTHNLGNPPLRLAEPDRGRAVAAFLRQCSVEARDEEGGRSDTHVAALAAEVERAAALRRHVGQLVRQEALLPSSNDPGRRRSRRRPVRLRGQVENLAAHAPGLLSGNRDPRTAARRGRASTVPRVNPAPGGGGDAPLFRVIRALFPLAVPFLRPRMRRISLATV